MLQAAAAERRLQARDRPAALLIQLGACTRKAKQSGHAFSMVGLPTVVAHAQSVQADPSCSQVQSGAVRPSPPATPHSRVALLMQAVKLCSVWRPKDRPTLASRMRTKAGALHLMSVGCSLGSLW